MASNVRSIEIGTTSMSPQSATRSRWKGWTLRTGFHVRISDDCSRTARGPKRAPGRYDVPPSYRSEERRVGKGCRSRWAPDDEKEKEDVAEGAQWCTLVGAD